MRPGAGGRVVALAWGQENGGVPLLVPLAQEGFGEHDWPKAGAFPMLPFASRLPREGFAFRGREDRPHLGPHGVAVHGFGHRLPWSLLERSGTHVVLQLAYDGASEGWPWSWLAWERVALGEAGLQVTLTVRNTSTKAMPGRPFAELAHSPGTLPNGGLTPWGSDGRGTNTAGGPCENL